MDYSEGFALEIRRRLNKIKNNFAFVFDLHYSEGFALEIRQRLNKIKNNFAFVFDLH